MTLSKNPKPVDWISIFDIRYSIFDIDIDIDIDIVSYRNITQAMTDEVAPQMSRYISKALEIYASEFPHRYICQRVSAYAD